MRCVPLCVLQRSILSAFSHGTCDVTGSFFPGVILSDSKAVARVITRVCDASSVSTHYVVTVSVTARAT